MFWFCCAELIGGETPLGYTHWPTIVDKKRRWFQVIELWSEHAMIGLRIAYSGLNNAYFSHFILSSSSSSSSYSYFGFSRQWLRQRSFHHHPVLSSASSSVISATAMSSLAATCIDLLSGIPSFLFPGSSILSILLSLCPSSFLRTCMSNRPQSCLSCFLSKPPHMRFPSDALIPDIAHSCHS